MKRNERALRTMWDTSSIPTYTEREGQEKGDEGVENISKEIMTEDFKFIKIKNLHIWEVQQTPKESMQRPNTSDRHTTVKMPKVKGKRKF